MRHGPLSEDPEFRTVSAPDEFGWTTESAVRFVPDLRGERVLGYLWAAVSDDAAGFAVTEPASDDSLNASVAWVQRLRWAKANGLTPLAALSYWAGEPEDPRAGHIPADSEREAPTLGELKRMAQADGTASAGA